MLITRRLNYRGVELVVIPQPDSSLACIPGWMTHETAAQYGLSEEPSFPLDILRSLRAEIDALLGFLRSESNTGIADNDAQNRKFQLSLFDENKPRCELVAAQRADLATLVEALLREIATALAEGDSANDQDQA